MFQTNFTLTNLRWDGNDVSTQTLRSVLNGLQRNVNMTVMPIPILDIVSNFKQSSADAEEVTKIVEEIQSILHANSIGKPIQKDEEIFEPQKRIFSPVSGPQITTKGNSKTPRAANIQQNVTPVISFVLNEVSGGVSQGQSPDSSRSIAGNLLDGGLDAARSGSANRRTQGRRLAGVYNFNPETLNMDPDDPQLEALGNDGGNGSSGEAGPPPAAVAASVSVPPNKEVPAAPVVIPERVDSEFKSPRPSTLKQSRTGPSRGVLKKERTMGSSKPPREEKKDNRKGSKDKKRRDTVHEEEKTDDEGNNNKEEVEPSPNLGIISDGDQLEPQESVPPLSGSGFSLAGKVPVPLGKESDGESKAEAPPSPKDDPPPPLAKSDGGSNKVETPSRGRRRTGTFREGDDDLLPHAQKGSNHRRVKEAGKEGEGDQGTPDKKKSKEKKGKEDKKTTK